MRAAAPALMAVELAARGGGVAVDISPALVEIARPERLPRNWPGGSSLGGGRHAGPCAGPFDHVLAMDSMIYYGPDLAALEARIAPRLSGRFVFTVAPRTPLLMAMWHAGKLFPRADRSPHHGAACPARHSPGA
jgi:magnesium-protoporphyrin O-methyltransferase